MTEEIKMNQKEENMIMLNDEEITKASGGAARGQEWQQLGMTYYRIARGDTLSDIARRFHTSSEAIKALNPILINTLDGIREGWEIRVL